MKTFDITIPAVRHVNSAGEAYTVPPRLLRITRHGDGRWSYVAPPDDEPFDGDEAHIVVLCRKCDNWPELRAAHFPGGE